MALNSIKFLIFLVLVVGLYYISPKKYKWVILLVSSYIFYYLSSSKLVFFLLLSTLSIYLAGLWIEKQNDKITDDLTKEEKKAIKLKIKRNKKRILILTLLINFGILVSLKYINFLGQGINFYFDYLGFDFDFPIFKFILPLGISYYTLQAVSYVVDIYRGKYKPTKHLGKVALFVSFFPPITEGPIGRFEYLSEQLYQPNKFKISNILYGSSLILLGFFKKMVIADRAGIFVNAVFGYRMGGLTVIVAGILYTLQIYAEFSGCMDIVRGSSKLFGITLAQNFKRPFFSKSIQEFWQRWHITLGAWIKEYIFYPISLSHIAMSVNMACRKHLKGHLGKFIVVAFPLLFVWLFNGIWHGASLKYVGYGMYYYCIMMVGLFCLPIGKKIIKWLKINIDSWYYRLFQILRTNVFVVFGMMLFRSSSLKEFTKMIYHIFTIPYSGIFNHGLAKIDFLILLICVIILFIIGLQQEKGKKLYSKFKKINVVIQVLIYVIIIMSIVILGIYGPGYNVSDFIYGQF